mmetsp:Transcript_71148/g.200741  ORF Transcript_71148/g.200741 Transcript_71148/m.200741 type:complete len:498 (+) Transcript_71148:815-2308(+)
MPPKEQTGPPQWGAHTPVVKGVPRTGTPCRVTWTVTWGGSRCENASLFTWYVTLWVVPLSWIEAWHCIASIFVFSRSALCSDTTKLFGMPPIGAGGSAFPRFAPISSQRVIVKCVSVSACVDAIASAVTAAQQEWAIEVSWSSLSSTIAVALHSSQVGCSNSSVWPLPARWSLQGSSLRLMRAAVASSACLIRCSRCALQASFQFVLFWMRSRDPWRCVLAKSSTCRSIASMMFSTKSVAFTVMVAVGGTTSKLVVNLRNCDIGVKSSSMPLSSTWRQPTCHFAISSCMCFSSIWIASGKRFTARGACLSRLVRRSRASWLGHWGMTSLPSTAFMSITGMISATFSSMALDLVCRILRMAYHLSSRSVTSMVPSCRVPIGPLTMSRSVCLKGLRTSFTTRFRSPGVASSMLLAISFTTLSLRSLRGPPSSCRCASGMPSVTYWNWRCLRSWSSRKASEGPSVLTTYRRYMVRMRASTAPMQQHPSAQRGLSSSVPWK